MSAQGKLSIAKFSSPASDSWDVIRWEAVALRLAADAGISVPAFELITVAGNPVLIVHRFDRSDAGRVGYVSAMTMLERGEREAGSYLDIAEVIAQEAPNVGADLEELWRRIAFTILISNTDDHLRNHGFLRRADGWALSPAFDLNPNPRAGATELATAIDFDDRVARIETLLSVHEYFDLTRDRAELVLGEVARSTVRWRSVAADNGLSSDQVEAMSLAFEHEQAEAASAFV